MAAECGESHPRWPSFLSSILPSLLSCFKLFNNENFFVVLFCILLSIQDFEEKKKNQAGRQQKHFAINQFNLNLLCASPAEAWAPPQWPPSKVQLPGFHREIKATLPGGGGRGRALMLPGGEAIHPSSECG